MTKTEAQIREETIRECIDALEAMDKEWSERVSGYRAVGNYGPYLGAPSYRDAAATVEALLFKPDPVAQIMCQIVDDYETMDDFYYAGMKEAVRRLISTGRLEP